MNAALSTTLKTNMEVFESYQAQFRKMVEANAQVLSQVPTPNFTEILKAQGEDLIRQVKQGIGL
jgi:hypothetical protein